MKSVSAAILLTLALISAARADDPRTEISILGGASFLEVDGEGVEAVDLGPFVPPGFRGRGLPALELRRRTSLGSSVLESLVVSRRVARRALVEVELSIAPGHDLRREDSLRCPPEICNILGVREELTGLFGGGLPARAENVVAYHYGLGVAYELTGGEARPFLFAGLGAVTYDVPGSTESDLAVSVGAGVRLHFGTHWGARVDVVDRILPDHFLGGDTQHDVHARVGLLLRLP
jgi:hypothetical protein